MDNIIEIVNKIIKPLKIRVVNLARLGKITLVKDAKTQSMQVLTLNNEVVENAKYVETFGFTSKPLIGSEAIIINICGNPANPVILKIGNRELRFKSLKAGEVAVYDAFGDRIHLKSDGIIEINAQNKAVVNAPKVVLGGDVGKPIARLGDEVMVDAITHKGTITSASDKVEAA